MKMNKWSLYAFVVTIVFIVEFVGIATLEWWGKGILTFSPGPGLFQVLAGIVKFALIVYGISCFTDWKE